MRKRDFAYWGLAIILLFVSVLVVQAKELKTEDDYVQQYCRGYAGDNKPLPDGTRADCFYDIYAIEYDWANFKWYECITQAKWYAMNTGRVPGCVLIVSRHGDMLYVDRARRLILHYNENVQLWILQNGKHIKVN